MRLLSGLPALSQSWWEAPPATLRITKTRCFPINLNIFTGKSRTIDQGISLYSHWSRSIAVASPQYHHYPFTYRAHDQVRQENFQYLRMNFKNKAAIIQKVCIDFWDICYSRLTCNPFVFPYYKPMIRRGKCPLKYKFPQAILFFSLYNLD